MAAEQAKPVRPWNWLGQAAGCAPLRGYGSTTRSEDDQTGANIYALLNQRAPKKKGRREMREKQITMMEVPRPQRVASR